MTESLLLSPRSLVSQNVFANRQREFLRQGRRVRDRWFGAASDRPPFKEEGRHPNFPHLQTDLQNVCTRELLVYGPIVIDSFPLRETDFEQFAITPSTLSDVLGGVITSSALSDALAAIIRTAALSLPIKLRKRIEQLSALQANWDSAGASAIRRDVLARVIHVLKAVHIRSESFVEPFISPTFDGLVQLEWRRGQRLLEIEFAPKGLSVVGGEGTEENMEYHTTETTSDDIEFIARCYNWLTGNEHVWPGPSP
jgi:hypothetical protein